MTQQDAHDDAAPSRAEALIQQLAIALAPLVAVELSRQAPPPAAGLIDASEVARRYGVDRAWVYDHARELGAIRLGSGRRPRLRFDPARVEEALQRTVDREPGRTATARQRRTPRRGPTEGRVELLPIGPKRALPSPDVNRRDPR
jgi:hypothetical protein